MKNTKYDFESVVDRHNTDSVKWDLFDDDLPMWVADMDFKVAPKISEAILERANHPVYGYTIVTDELFDAYISWWDRRYGLKMSREDMAYAMGVMPSISSMIRCLTDVGDEILIQTPVYHVFFYVIEENDRKVLENELIFENGEYKIDFDDLDEKLSKVKMMILCNPHNPIGKIWSREELDRIDELCRKHDVILISDEIHCDLTDPGVKYNPFRANDNVIRCLSPSKSFNIAGYQSSVVHATNPELLEKIKSQIHIDNSDSCNVFATTAVRSAYNESEDWLEELREVLYENKQIVRDYLSEELPIVKLIECDATYLLWLDCSALNTPSKALSEFLRQNQGLFISAGSDFGQCGDNFLRMNIACPQKLLKEGLDKLKAGVIALNNINRLSKNI
ncbi:MAG: pyridoxal phosphate-dependent aminotransferase [Methanobrevibacter thaueri]|jgi:cystathionine beta-lyase|uniref:MalY/PatB family protein n=1 Tax=Methanobrevibacter thaueri TaxID=190975 RepID=UPI0026ECC5EF|nr:MalY/PatB family protein [Methanobrevibacter thaueri]MBE6495896.1 pyridoxal phosphate-dependent aminotransferase [Methanobrevibacter thaueri]